MENNIKGIPYGITDYAGITRDNYYYVDKTHFIPAIEQAARFFFFIRPRRFGKTLLLNVLDAYYDINNTDKFEELFSERWIYQHPTNSRAKFLMLRFNFSLVDINPDEMERSFESHCREQFLAFASKYKRFLPADFKEELEKRLKAKEKLEYVNRIASELGLRIYLIIDEYDNFTNSILANMGTEAYHKATHGEGFYRLFFNALKGMTSGNNTALERMFITGVSPITLDDVTSGFNIGANFTTSPTFNNLVGFSEVELRTMLDYFYEQGVFGMSTDEMIEQMKPWYNNYCFATDCLNEYMYNSDMVLYYLNNYRVSGYPPEEMIDMNIRMDYSKLKHLISIDRQLGHNFSVIREIVEQGSTLATINTSFPVANLTNPDNFKSLLYYFGLLSIQGSSRGKAILGIPNHAVREQMYSYLTESYEHANIFRIDFDKISNLMGDMAYDGVWKPLFTYIASELEKQSRIREFIDGEAHVKGFLLAYMGMTHYYQLLPEYELAKGYTDFYFQPNPQLKDLQFAYLLEVKYMKRDEPDSRISTLKADARKQLLKYASDEFVTNTLGVARLKLATVVFRGWEIVEMEDVLP